MIERGGDLGEFVYILLKRRKFLILNTLIVTLLVMGGSFLLPLRFTATATLLPPKEDVGSSLLRMRRSLGQRFDLSNVPITGVTSNAQVYLTILRSRTVADSLIAEFHLVDRYRVKNVELARRALAAATDLGLASAGLIRVAVEDKDPGTAADMANAYVRHLDRINRAMSMRDGRRTRIFIEGRRRDTEVRLHAAEDSLLAYEQSHPGILLPGEDSSAAGAAAGLLARRISIGAELEMLRHALAPDAPALSRKEREVQALDRELRKLPAMEVALARRYRDFKIQERVFELLTAQFEQAQIQEHRDITTVEVLDPAIPPVRKSFPRRGILTGIAFLFSALAGAVIVITREALAALRSPAA